MNCYWKPVLVTALFLLICSTSYSQELITTSNELITRLEVRKPQVCRQLTVKEQPDCEQLFVDTIQAIRNKVAHFTKGDIPTARHWMSIEQTNIAEVLRRYGHLQVSKDLR